MVAFPSSIRMLPVVALLAVSAQAAPSKPAGLKADADAAFERGDYTTAAALYSAIVGEKPALAGDAAFKARWARAQSGACCEAAERFMARGNGVAALAQVREALLRDPDWERPRQLLPKAQAGAADAGYARALRLADAGQVEEVKRQLAQVVAWMPSHAKAQAALALLAQRPPAGSMWEKAVGAAEKSDWVTAETAFAAVLKGDAAHLPARAGLARAREAQAGAQLLVEKARVALQAGQLAAAQKRLDQAQSQWPGVPFGLALQDALRARRQAAGLALDQAATSARKAAFAEAQVAYREVLRHDPESAAARAGLVDAICREADELAAHGRSGAALLVCRRGRGLAPVVDQKAEAFLKTLRQVGLPTLRWQVEGEKAPATDLLKALSATTDGWGGGEPVTVHAKITALEASCRKLRQEGKVWPWFTEREEANPDYDAVQARLEAAENRHAMALAAHARAVRGQGDVRSAAAQVRQWQQVIGDLAAERAQIPMSRRVRQEHAQSYTDEVWQAKGRLAVAFSVADGEPEEREATYDRSDSVRIGAKPEVGLAADPLDLPADQAALRRELIQRMVAQWTPVLRRRVVVSQVVLLQRAAESAQQAGDGAGALELRVKAAALTGVSAPTLSEKELRKLE